MSDNADRTVPAWPNDPSGLTAQAVDFVAMAHVLANTCCWDGRSLTFLSLAQRALTASKGVEAMGGLTEEDERRLALYALLGDAWRAWLPQMPGEIEKGGTGNASDKHVRERERIHRTVLEAAGLEPDLPAGWARAQELNRLMAEAAVRRDLADAGIETGAREGGPLFPPLKARVRPMHPGRAAARWLERFGALRTAVLRTADRRTADRRTAERASPAPGGET